MNNFEKIKSIDNTDLMSSYIWLKLYEKVICVANFHFNYTSDKILYIKKWLEAECEDSNA